MDRNGDHVTQLDPVCKSLSARRAWIEMTSLTFCSASFAVALRKESVDRNLVHVRDRQLGAVALRKESVDRNIGAS